MVTLILTNTLCGLEPDVKIRFVKSSVGMLPSEQNISFYQWWHQIKATREQLTEDLKDS